MQWIACRHRDFLIGSWNSDIGMEIVESTRLGCHWQSLYIKGAIDLLLMSAKRRGLVSEGMHPGQMCLHRYSQRSERVVAVSSLK
jgi:hypothetical protein